MAQEMTSREQSLRMFEHKEADPVSSLEETWDSTVERWKKEGVSDWTKHMQMDWEYSCGAIVFTKRDGQLLFVIVQEQAGAYSFPKGHMEGDETEAETARREVFEEIGLHPVFIDGFCRQDEYPLAEKPGTWKRVTYFLAECGNEKLLPREGEIRRIHLLPYEDAVCLFEHENTRRILTDAYEFLTK